MKSDELLACQFSVWYPKFKKCTFESLIIPLPADFIAYLLSDGVVLPGKQNTGTVDDSDDDSVDWEAAEAETPEAEAPVFTELNQAVTEAIARLGGKVFPKLNWSSPKDAAWIAFNNSLCCYSYNDVYQLLKSSNFISHDLTEPFITCADQHTDSLQYTLVLRKWTDMNPGHEYRCFVKDNELIGVSQREATDYYHHIRKERESIVKDISTFYHEKIKNKFPQKSFVFDVLRTCKDVVELVDFNPYGKITDSVLFDWEELTGELGVVDSGGSVGAYTALGVQLRYIGSSTGVQPCQYNQYSIPVDVCSGRNLTELIKAMQESKSGESDDEQD